MAAISAGVVPGWREMLPELCQSLSQPSPKARAMSPEPHGRGAGQEARLVPVMLSRLQGREKGSTAGQRMLCPFIMQPVGSPDGGMQRHSTGMGHSSRDQPRGEDANTTGPLFLSAVPKNGLFAPPMGKQRADPHHCGGLHELQQPHHHSSRKMSPPV